MIERVSFFSEGAKLVGSLWLPSGGGPHPGVLVTGSWMTVKEQMPASYAPRLAEAGFVALTFDFKGFGESGGDPREVESPYAKAEDLRSAASFLRADRRVRGVGALCICASAGYLTQAMAGDSPVDSAAFVAPWLHDSAIVEQLYGGVDAVRARLRQASDARATYVAHGEVRYQPAASNSDPAAAMYWTGDALDYYLNPKRGRIPAWGARFATMAWTQWLGFDPIALAPRLRTPLRIVTGENTATPMGVRAFEKGLAIPSDSHWIPGTQFDFYDDPNTVDRASALAIDHLRRTLA